MCVKRYRGKRGGPGPGKLQLLGVPTFHVSFCRSMYAFAIETSLYTDPENPSIVSASRTAYHCDGGVYCVANPIATTSSAVLLTFANMAANSASEKNSPCATPSTPVVSWSDLYPPMY